MRKVVPNLGLQRRAKLDADSRLLRAVRVDDVVLDGSASRQSHPDTHSPVPARVVVPDHVGGTDPGCGSAADDSESPDPPPALTGLRLLPGAFRSTGPQPLRRGRLRLAPLGARVSFGLSEPAAVAFSIERPAPGRRAGRLSVAPTARNRRTPRCTRYLALPGSFRRAGAPGPNAFRFGGFLAGSPLGLGAYRLVAVAFDAAGQRSAPARASLRIVPR